MRGDRGGAGGDRDRHPERASAARRPRRRWRPRPRRRCRRAGSLLSRLSAPIGQDRAERGGREDAADEGQQQQDRGQRHAPLGGEEQGQAPGGRGDRQRAERARAVAVDRQADRLADRLADPADREQQDRGGDRDENVVEAGEQPEMLFVDGRRRAAGVRNAAKRRRGFGAERPAATASSSSF